MVAMTPSVCVLRNVLKKRLINFVRTVICLKVLFCFCFKVMSLGLVSKSGLHSLTYTGAFRSGCRVSGVEVTEWRSPPWPWLGFQSGPI